MYVLQCIWVVTESLNWAEWNYSNPQVIHNFHFPSKCLITSLHHTPPGQITHTHTRSWPHMWTHLCKLRVRPVVYCFCLNVDLHIPLITFTPSICTSQYFTPTTASVCMVHSICVECQMSLHHMMCSVCATLKELSFTSSHSEVQQREEVPDEKVSEAKQQQQAPEILV